MNKKLMQGGILIGSIIAACIIAGINEHERKKEIKRAQEFNKQMHNDLDKMFRECEDALVKMEAEKIHKEKVDRLNQLRREGLI